MEKVTAKWRGYSRKKKIIIISVAVATIVVLVAASSSSGYAIYVHNESSSSLLVEVYIYKPTGGGRQILEHSGSTQLQAGDNDLLSTDDCSGDERHIVVQITDTSGAEAERQLDSSACSLEINLSDFSFEVRPR